MTKFETVRNTKTGTTGFLVCRYNRTNDYWYAPCGTKVYRSYSDYCDD